MAETAGFEEFLKQYNFKEKKQFHFMEILLIERIQSGIKAARTKGISDDEGLSSYLSGYLSNTLIVERSSDSKHCFYVPDRWVTVSNNEPEANQ
jgi:hypothetical protein